MGRGSVKENKSKYQEARELRELTRAEASELLAMSESKIEKIENGQVHPDDVVVMADAYKMPSLCNYYCSHDCPLGESYIPAVNIKDLPTVTLEILEMLNKLDAQKQRLVEICVDGDITDEEMADYVQIQEKLDKLSLSIASLKAWVDEKVSSARG